LASASKEYFYFISRNNDVSPLLFHLVYLTTC